MYTIDIKYMLYICNFYTIGKQPYFNKKVLDGYLDIYIKICLHLRKSSVVFTCSYNNNKKRFCLGILSPIDTL